MKNTNTTTSTNNTVVTTHNGAFHTDEIVAIALYKAFVKSDITIIRTRDTKLLKESDIRIDVGGKYDGQRNFDHHQFNEDHELYGLSSAGLMLKALTKPSKDLVKFIKAVDSRDTFVNYDREGKYVNLFNNISSCNKMDVNSKEQDERFLELVELFTIHFLGEISYTDLEKAIEKIAEDEKVIADKVYKSRMETLDTVITVEDLEVYAVKDFEYVPMYMIDAKVFVMWDDLQKCWSVQVDTEFYKILSGSKSKFIHANGFIGKFDKGEVKLLDVKSNKEYTISLDNL